MTQCSAFGCKNKGMHVFPKDPKRRKLWERALRRKNWKATNTSRLCSSHFKSDDYYGISAYTGNEPLAKFLKRTAIPSVFSFSKTETPLAKERQARIENRNRRTLLTSTETPSTSIETPCTSSHIENVEDTIEVSTIEGIHQFPQNIIINPTNEQGTQVNIEHVYGCLKRFVNDDEAISFYTGFESYRKFYFVYSTLSPMASNIQYYGSNVININTEDQFFLTMIKLRQDRCNFELSRFFNISQTTVSNVFITFINFIHQLWSRLNIWPDKDLVEYYTPDGFRKYSSCTHVILDGTEIKVQKPQNSVSQQASWSSYKHANTLKVLVGATPGGLLSYCSEAYGGSVSDRQTVERSNLLQKCDPGDSILADRGFNIQDLFAGKDITVNIPTFLKGKSQIPRLTVLHDRKLASKRVHIERLIGLISDGYGLDLSTSMLDVDWVDSIKTNNLNSLFASINIIFIFIAMIEVCIDSLESAINAVHGGADELEVCSSLTEGGLTPSPGFVKQIVGMVNNIAVGKPIRKSCHDCGCDKLTKRPKVNVMIRCRTGSDFHYSVEEMDTMISDVDVFKTFGVDRFVFGALTETQHIDVINCERLIRQAYPIPVTFHRAFDVCMNPLLSIAKIAELGFNRLLTSGQKPTANDVEAIQLIKSLISSAGDKVEIMPGAGINLDNAKIFIDIGCKIVHSSCKRIRYLPQIKNGLSMGTSDSEHVFVTDENIVKKMKEIVNEN